MIYLASPYSHPSTSIQEERVDAVVKAAAALMGEGLHVYSPIAYSHQLHQVQPLQHHEWLAFDRIFISSGFITSLAILSLPQWEASTGIAYEVMLATHNRLPIYFVDPAQPAELQWNSTFETFVVENAQKVVRDNKDAWIEQNIAFRSEVLSFLDYKVTRKRQA